MPDRRPSIRFHLKTKGNQEFVLSYVEVSNGSRTVPWRVKEARGHETMRAFCIALLFTKFRSDYELNPPWYEITEPKEGKNWAKTFSESLDDNKIASNAKWWFGGEEGYRGLGQDVQAVCGSAFPFEAHEHGTKAGFKIIFKATNRDGESCWAIWRLKFFDENKKEIRGPSLLKVARKFEIDQQKWVKKENKWKSTLPSDRVIGKWNKRENPVPNLEAMPARVQAFVNSEIYSSVRQNLMSQITNALRPGDKNCARAVLHGISGMGKTQTALYYAHECIKDKRRFTTVWWIRSDLPETMALDYAALAYGLGIVEENTPPHIAIPCLRGHLAAREKWLLIFDSAINDQITRAYFPDDSGHILITSQDESWDDSKIIPIPTWTEKIATAFLLKRTGRAASDGPAAKKIASTVHFHPLSLEQIASYLNAPEAKRTPMPLEVFLRDTLQRAIRSQPEELLRRLEKHAPKEHAQGIATTFDLAFGKITPAAAELINLCAFFAPDKISSQMLAAGAEHLPLHLREIIDNTASWANTLELVRTYSLVLPSISETFSMHGLVQLVARCKLAENARKEYAERALRVLLSAFAAFPENKPRDSEDLEHQNGGVELQWDDVFPHFVETCNIIKDYGYQLNERSSSVARLVPYLYSRVDPRQIGAPLDRISPDAKMFRVMFSRIALKAEKEMALERDLENAMLPWRESNKIRLALAFNLFFRGEIERSEREFDQITSQCKRNRALSQDFTGMIALPMLATIRNYQGDFSRGLALSKEVLGITGGLHNDVDRRFIQPAGQALWALAEATMRINNFRVLNECKLALTYLNKSYAMIERWYPQAKAFCLAALGLVQAHLGDLAEATEKCTRARNEEMVDPFARGVAYFYSGEVSRIITRKQETPDFTEAINFYKDAYNVFNLTDAKRTNDPDATEYLFYRARCKFQIAATYFEQESDGERPLSQEHARLALQESARYGVYRDYWIRDSSEAFSNFVKMLIAGTSGFDAEI